MLVETEKYLSAEIDRLRNFLNNKPEFIREVSGPHRKYERGDSFNHNSVLDGTCQAAERKLEACLEAYTRIENHTYGICLRCDKEISQSRLWANPEVALCKKCQQKKEEKERKKKNGIR